MPLSLARRTCLCPHRILCIPICYICRVIKRLFLFVLINFAALAIGGISTGTGVASQWYASLAKAPWTPPGWVFGAAWTLIMICFSFYMAYLWPLVANKRLLAALYAIQLLLNVVWNPLFFTFHWVFLSMLIICSLTLLIAFMLVFYWQSLRTKNALLLPYFLWLLIATSLNGYILIYN